MSSSTQLVGAAGTKTEALVALAIDGLNSPHSKRAYAAALTDFLNWCGGEHHTRFTKATVQKYKAKLESTGLSASSINVRMSAIRRLALEAADNGLLQPELAAGISRVKGAKHSGVRTGNWLNVQQAEGLINSPDISTLKGKRDRALLALMLGCGLRRAEVAVLDFDHVDQREGRWAIVDLIGKHGRIRTVPMPSWTKAAIDNWAESAGINLGRIFRAINKGSRITHESMTPQSIFEAVKHYAAQIGLNIAPHDLRRTYAKLAHRGRAALEQIQLSLGHASIVTTERYLGVKQDLTDAPCDHLGLNLVSKEPGLVETIR
jgi:site-specific recombinase XerD